MSMGFLRPGAPLNSQDLGRKSVMEKHREAQKTRSGWWFQTFFMFHTIWDNVSH